MDIKYLEQKFIQLHKDIYVENEDIKFYVPTDNHISGFNIIEIWNKEDSEFGEYGVEEENGGYIDECYLTFEGIVKKYPKITLDREYAFYGKFVSWEDIELAFKGEKEIDLLRI